MKGSYSTVWQVAMRVYKTCNAEAWAKEVLLHIKDLKDLKDLTLPTKSRPLGG